MKVVLALGASCTGKSSLCGELARNHQWKVADTDEFYYQAYSKAQAAVGLIIASLSEKAQQCLARYDLAGKLVDFPITGELYLNHEVKIGIESVHEESIQTLLKEAGIQDADIPLLATCLREVAKQSEAIKGVTLFRGLEPFFNSFLEYTFAQKLEPDDTIILDVNPHPGFGPAQILAATEQHIQSYSSAHPEQSVEFYKVLAYCPPLELSKRLKQREESGYKGNTGRGLYSFEQLSQLVTAVPSDYKGPDAIDTLSAADIGIIVDSRVPETRDNMEAFIKTRNGLASKFGIHGDSVKLVAAREFPCDVVVNTSKADATALAETLVDNITECAAPRQATMTSK